MVDIYLKGDYNKYMKKKNKILGRKNNKLTILIFLLIFTITTLYLGLDIYKDNLKMRRLTKEIITGCNNQKQMAIAIIKWVNKNLPVNPSIKLPNIFKTPTFILKHGGVCGSFAKLSAVLMRKTGIPARLLYLYNNGRVVHVVTEAYIERKWCIFDAFYGYVFFKHDSVLASAEELRDSPEILFSIVDTTIYPLEYTYADVRRTNWQKFHLEKLYRFLKKRIGSKADSIAVNVILLRPKIFIFDLLLFVDFLLILWWIIVRRKTNQLTKEYTNL